MGLDVLGSVLRNLAWKQDVLRTGFIFSFVLDLQHEPLMTCLQSTLLLCMSHGCHFLKAWAAAQVLQKLLGFLVLDVSMMHGPTTTDAHGYIYL